MSQSCSDEEMKAHLRRALIALSAVAVTVGLLPAQSVPSSPTTASRPTDPISASSADHDPKATSRRNEEDFDFVTQTIGECYAGYDYKRSEYGPEGLSRLTDDLRSQASRASDAELYTILKKWMDFWRDGHTAISLAAPAPPLQAPVTPSRALSEEVVRAKLISLGARHDPLEGIWRVGSDYRVAVLREDSHPDRFDAVVLTTDMPSWTPGQVKAEITRKPDRSLKLLYRDSAHVEHTMDGHLAFDGAVFQPELFAAWVREVPALPDAGLIERELPTNNLVLKRVSPRTLWLRIPSFIESQAAPLRDLLAQHAADLSKTPNLIIDLRNNGGGSDAVYEPLLKLLYTRPTYEIGVELRACQRNIDLRRAIATSMRKDLPEVADQINAQAVKMSQHLGEYVQANGQPFSISTEAKVEPYPIRIVILIDGAASTAEQFLLTARQSTKVTLMGQHRSAGVLDFANVVSDTVPSGRFRLQWAISRSLRLPQDPVDPDGFSPQVKIPADVKDPVGFAAAWLERQPTE